jgi:hypothetical protein
MYFKGNNERNTEKLTTRKQETVKRKTKERHIRGKALNSSFQHNSVAPSSGFPQTGVPVIMELYTMCTKSVDLVFGYHVLIMTSFREKKLT